MARSKTQKKVKEPAPEEEEAEYVIGRILGHKRQKGELKYQIEWEGYEDDKPTWESEENVGEGPLVEEYWKKCTTPLDRYVPGSKAYRLAAKAVQSNASPKKTKTSTGSSQKKYGKKRALAARDGETDDNEKPKKRGRQESNGNEVAKVAEEEDADGSVYDEDRVLCDDWREKYGALDSWEDEVQEIDTMEQDEDGSKLRVCIVWKDNSVTWLDAGIIRQRCPQKLLDFFISHLKWKKKEQDDADDAMQEEFEETAEVAEAEEIAEETVAEEKVAEEEVAGAEVTGEDVNGHDDTGQEVIGAEPTA